MYGYFVTENIKNLNNYKHDRKFKDLSNNDYSFFYIIYIAQQS